MHRRALRACESSTRFHFVGSNNCLAGQNITAEIMCERKGSSRTERENPWRIYRSHAHILSNPRFARGRQYKFYIGESMQRHFLTHERRARKKHYLRSCHHNTWDRFGSPIRTAKIHTSSSFGSSAGTTWMSTLRSFSKISTYHGIWRLYPLRWLCTTGSL